MNHSASLTSCECWVQMQSSVRIAVLLTAKPSLQPSVPIFLTDYVLNKNQFYFHFTFYKWVNILTMIVLYFDDFIYVYNYLGHIHPSSSLPAAFSFFSLTCVCLYVHRYILRCSCGSQRTTRGSWFSPFTCQAISCNSGRPGTHSGAADNDFILIPLAPPPGNYRCSAIPSIAPFL